MESTYIKIEFGIHVPESSISSIVTGIASYGNIQEGASHLCLVVEVFRKSSVEKLKKRLLEWERYGFLRWQVSTQPDARTMTGR